ncbi:MAG: amidohydrolase family protein [Deltaproteobacteria bacterium]|nr:amidohydrolase family protein [Deltaproteobacteria bacterium]
MRIDAHAHLYPERFLNLIEAQGEKYPIQIVRPGPGEDRKLIISGKEFFSFAPDFFDVDVRLSEMAESNVDMQVLSLAPPMVYWAEPSLGLELCRIFNDEIAVIVRCHPHKFVALAAVPLQDVTSAIEELTRAVEEYDARGVLMPTNVGGQDIDAPHFEPFYEAVLEKDLPIFIHPIPRAGPEGLRMRDYRLDVTVGFAMDTTIAAARIVLSGIFPRLQGLRIILSHLGGTIPFLWGRLSDGFKMFAGEWEWGDPTDFFRQFYFDAISYRPEPLEYAVKLVGAERILYGSDDPFFGEDNMRHCAENVLACTCLDAKARGKIFGETAARLFRIDI